jgi:hypothetical protein
MQQKKKKKGKKSNYFNEDTEAAVLEFQRESDIEKRKKIFVEKIQFAFCKLIENIIFVYKFHTLGNIEVLKNDCLSFLFENLNKFDHTRGHRAFSYFNVITKNWFIQRVKGRKKKNRCDITFDKDAISFLEKNNSDIAVVSYEDLAVKEEFFSLLKEETKKWRDKFEKQHESKVLEAVILLLENPDLITIYNKKGIYLYIREITGLNTKQIVTNLMKIRKKYSIFKRKYLSGEI